MSLAPSRYARFEHIVFRGAPSMRAGFGPVAPRLSVARANRSVLAGVTETKVETRDAETDAFVRFVLYCAGIDPGQYRYEPLARRIPACLRALRARSLAHARQLIECDARRLDAAVSSLLIGVSSFFRDREVFDYLDATVLPTVLATYPTPAVWSAGCSTGQELYSVAMLLGGRGALRSSYLLGTDCRAEAVRQASTGAYTNEEVSAIPPGLRSAHLIETAAGVFVRDEVRRSVRWQAHDAAAHELPRFHFDLILCRNMAIYLTPDAAQSLMRRLVSRLRPGGFLVLGRAEKPHLRCLRRTGPCTYHYAGGAVA